MRPRACTTDGQSKQKINVNGWVDSEKSKRFKTEIESGDVPVVNAISTSSLQYTYEP